MAALEGDRTNHAYLFSGPRGCGKTTSARILARCLNCANGPTATPCGTCDSCVELSRDGSGSLDVVEMDAASHGGVEDARDLRERAGFAPVRDRYKVFIIDEAHMVSPQGFNALLKLVEEPPPHVKFIFATTEPEKVIGTIRSRTHHYPFRLVPPGVLEEYMAGLCRQENVTVEDGVLPLVVRAGTGSVRDSLSVLDQLIGGAGNDTVSYQTAISLLGYTDGALLDATVDAIADSDGGALFEAVGNVVESGLDPRRFVEDLLERLRDLVVLALAGDEARSVLGTVPEDQLGRMKDQAARLGASRASKSADLTNTALSDMVGATSPRLQLELLCARLLLASATVQQTVSGGGTAGAADARAAARNFKKGTQKETPKDSSAAPAAQTQATPSAAQAPSTPVVPPASIAPATPPNKPGRLVPEPTATTSEPAQSADAAPASSAPASSSPSVSAPEASAPQAPAQTAPAAPVATQPAPEELTPSPADEAKLNTIRGLWKGAMADRRVPAGTSPFIRDNKGATKVLAGDLHFDFPTEDIANQFVDEGRSGGLQTVFSELLGEHLEVIVGVLGARKASVRESADDAEGDRQVASASPASIRSRDNYGLDGGNADAEETSGDSARSDSSPAEQSAPSPSPDQSVPSNQSAPSGPTAQIAQAQQSDRAVRPDAPHGSSAAGSAVSVPGTNRSHGGGSYQSAIERASARSAAGRASAPSPVDAGGSSYVGAPARGSSAGSSSVGGAMSSGSNRVPSSNFPYGEPTPPADDEYGDMHEDAYGGLPADLPDIVREDFPAPPPAAMPKFPAPPPRQAPTTGGPVHSRGAVESLDRLTANRRLAPVEEEVEEENVDELISDDDPLAIDTQGVGLQVVLDTFGGQVIEEIEEEA